MNSKNVTCSHLQYHEFSSNDSINNLIANNPNASDAYKMFFNPVFL